MPCRSRQHRRHPVRIDCFIAHNLSRDSDQVLYCFNTSSSITSQAAPNQTLLHIQSDHHASSRCFPSYQPLPAPTPCGKLKSIVPLFQKWTWLHKISSMNMHAEISTFAIASRDVRMNDSAFLILVSWLLDGARGDTRSSCCDRHCAIQFFTRLSHHYESMLLVATHC